MISLDSLSTSDRRRAKELIVLLIIQRKSRNLLFWTDLHFDDDEISGWEDQLGQLAGVTEVRAWLEALDAILEALDPLSASSQQSQSPWGTRSQTASPELLAEIEKYQNASPVVYETNFSDTPLYSDLAVAERIALLYTIGSKAGILQASETFDHYTRVTQQTQEVCDRVVRWLESSLGLVMEPVNVYLPWIWDYQRFKHLRPETLHSIGIRSGLLKDKPLAEMSRRDCERVATWVKHTYDVDLPIDSLSPKQRTSPIWFGLTVLLAGSCSLIYLASYCLSHSCNSDSSFTQRVKAEQAVEKYPRPTIRFPQSVTTPD